MVLQDLLLPEVQLQHLAHNTCRNTCCWQWWSWCKFPYSLCSLAGGATSTGPTQQVSGLGTTGYVLTSNGAGTLPSWQPATGGGGTADSVDIYTGSTNYTIPNTTNVEVINPSSVQTFNITLPTTFPTSNLLYIHFGGTVTSGAIWSGTVLYGSWTVIDNTPAGSATPDNVLIYWRNPKNNIVYRRKP